MNKINPGDKFVTISIDNKGVRVSRESEVKRVENATGYSNGLTAREFCDSNNRYSDEHLYPCELNMIKPVNFEPSLFMYVKVEDIEAATAYIKDQFIKFCNNDIDELQALIQKRIDAIHGIALTLS